MPFAKAKRLSDRHTPSLEQEAVAKLIRSDSYERHVRRVRRRNGERRAALLTALSATLGDAVTVVGVEAGLHVVVWLNGVPRDQEESLIATASAAGLGVYPVTPLYAPASASASASAADRPQVAGLVVGYASLDARSILYGVQLLEKVLETLRKGKA
ncbi:aminotransferase-like domain-containing protein [Muricoccus vinaceus]|uniref:Uncharacterized protein n=1 Tax=Muricoccus vinaceus TaxID=424704 RepID=A0ABV6IQA5_9PROT